MPDSNNSEEDHVNIGAACFRCRGFRHACDRQKPTCSRCQRKGVSCVYPEAAPSLKKLQNATETLSNRIKKFNDNLKANGSVVNLDDGIPSRPRQRLKSGRVALTTNFSVYPCTKCFKDLQQCDLLLPKCTRCMTNNLDCDYKKTEPKANHVSQALTTMNKVLDQWQESIDRKAKEFAQKTRKRLKQANQTAFRITTTRKGLSIESNVYSYNDLAALVDQFKRSMCINNNKTLFQQIPAIQDFDASHNIQTASGFIVWDSWVGDPTRSMPQDYPIDITDELTDDLVNLYCRTPCCSSIRLPIINTTEFLSRYNNPDTTKRPSKVLIYAVCAMAARNAFQLHIWTKDSIRGYNMGKALSVAYCLLGRELLSECFDEPSFDHCRAALLLSYCNHQNGYPGVINIYEWVAFSMAADLGLYDAQHELTKEESMFIWCLYYFNVWHRTLQGTESANSGGLTRYKPPLETMPKPIPFPTDKEQLVEYYVWNSWVYLIQLQISLVALASQSDQPQEFFEMQKTLAEFHDNLPDEWQQQTQYAETTCAHHDTNEPYKTDIKSFATYCVQLVQIHYYVAQIVLYKPFVPSYRAPSTPLSVSSLDTILEAANQISHILETMSLQQGNCYIPLVAFLFANVVYTKLMTYHDHFHQIGKQGLLRSLDISKSSTAYYYDFELARSLVNNMEQGIKSLLE